MTPQQKAILLRFLKVLAFTTAAFALTGVASFLSGNSLGLPDTYQTLITLVLIPIFAAAEKWLTWQAYQ